MDNIPHQNPRFTTKTMTAQMYCNKQKSIVNHFRSMRKVKKKQKNKKTLRSGIILQQNINHETLRLHSGQSANDCKE